VIATLFRPFSQVEAGEAMGVAVLTFAAFLLLTSYYLLKTVREPLILLQGGAEVKIYARAGQALLMAVFVHFYGELARYLGRTKLLGIVFLFFISNLVVFATLADSPVKIGLAFFLWVGVFSYTIVAQFWGLAADLCSDEQGKRLFPIIGAGSSLGAGPGLARVHRRSRQGAPAPLSGRRSGTRGRAASCVGRRLSEARLIPRLVSVRLGTIGGRFDGGALVYE
jgi:hypothetical protein